MSRKQILFVDDQRYVLDLLRPAFQTLGRAYKFFTTPQDALDDLGAGDIGLILCDIRLGNASGLDFIEEVRGKPDFAHIPIVVLSQYSDRETVDRAMACGADDYIVKPFKIKRIVDALASWLALEDTALRFEGQTREQARLARLTMATMGRSMAAARDGEQIPYQMMRQNCLSILQGGNDATIVKMLSQIKQKNVDIYLHSVKFAAHIGLMAAAFVTDKEEMLDVITAGLLHDIGMARIPDSFFENDKLTKEEYAFVTVRHVELAKKILKEQPTPLPKIVELIATLHHERLDGSGPFKMPAENLANVVKASCVIEEFLERKAGLWLGPQPARRIFEAMQSDKGFDRNLVDALMENVGEV